MAVTNVIELLVKIGVLDDRQHDAVMSRAKSGAGGDMVREIAELGFATESTIARVLSVELGLPRVDIGITPPEHEALGLLDLKTCTERFVLPVALRENGELLWLAMGDPTDTDAMALVRRKTNKRVRPVVAGPSEIVREARRLYVMPMTPGSDPRSTGALPGATQPSGGIELIAPPDDEKMEIVQIGDDSAAPIERIAAQLGVQVPEQIRRRMPGEEGVEIDLGGGSDTLVDQRPLQIPNRPAPSIPPPQVQQVAKAPPRPGARIAPPTGPMKVPPPTGPMRTAPPQAPMRTAPRAGTPPPPPPMSLEPDVEKAAASIDHVVDSQPDDPLAPPPVRPWPYKDDLGDADVASIENLRTSMEKGALVLRALAELCVEKSVFTREEMRKKNR